MVRGKAVAVKNQGSNIVSPSHHDEECSLVRVRHAAGMERFTLNLSTTTIEEFRALVQLKCGVGELVLSTPGNPNPQQNSTAAFDQDLEASSTLKDAGIKHGDLFLFSPVTSRVLREKKLKEKASKESEKPTENTRSLSRKRNKQNDKSSETTPREKKAKNVSKCVFPDYKATGKGVRELAADYRSERWAYEVEFSGKTSSDDRAVFIFDQFANAARVAAVLHPRCTGRVEWVTIEVLKDIDPKNAEQSGRMKVTFRGEHPKLREDECPLLSFQMMRDLAVMILLGVPRKRGGELPSMKILEVDEIAKRWPPLLWSLYYYSSVEKCNDSNRIMECAIDELHNAALEYLNRRQNMIANARATTSNA
mmetsp:Transcript_7324/g.13223  ORF Transcript_7324/g.13223 Transcript_7324/m.13223 type:complete len:365 (-) Transcript_7324:71-1165(-)